MLLDSDNMRARYIRRGQFQSSAMLYEQIYPSSKQVSRCKQLPLPQYDDMAFDYAIDYVKSRLCHGQKHTGICADIQRTRYQILTVDNEEWLARILLLLLQAVTPDQNAHTLQKLQRIAPILNSAVEFDSNYANRAHNGKAMSYSYVVLSQAIMVLQAYVHAFVHDHNEDLPSRVLQYLAPNCLSSSCFIKTTCFNIIL